MINVDYYESLKKKPVKSVKQHRFTWFDVLNYAAMVVLALICLFPVVYEVLLSVSSRADYLKTVGDGGNILVLPYHFNFENYKFIFGQGRVPRAFAISIFITVVGTIYSMILTCFGAYAFTKKKVPFAKVFFFLIIFQMFFSGGTIPFFLHVQGTIGLNNLWCLIIPFGINSFNLIILRNFFSQVPNDLIENARLEGLNEFQILFKIVIPLSKPGLATILLWYVISYWDAWYWASFFLPKATDLYPLALELRNILQKMDGSNPSQGADGSYLFSQGTNAATIVISILPILIFYPFLQKYFVKGYMKGSVKG